MGRRISKGRKGIAYYDHDGYKQYVFDANDTHGDRRYLRPILPMKRLLGGLDELNGTDYADDERSDYRKIHRGVQLYLKEQGELSGEDANDGLKIEGIAYMLYCKTGFPKTSGIAFHGLPYSFKENADFVKELYILTDGIVEDIENAYQSKEQEPVTVIDDTDEETVSDEPMITQTPTEQVREPNEQDGEAAEEEPIAKTEAKQTHAPEQGKQPVEQTDESKLPPYYRAYLKQERENPNSIVAIRVGDFYEFMNKSAEIISQELDLTLTGRNVGLSERVPMCGIPYHASDNYFEKILKKHELIVIEDFQKEPIRILSHEEVKNLQGNVYPDDEPNPFDEEEQPAHVGGIDTRFPIGDDDSDEDEQDADEEYERDEDELSELEDLIDEEREKTEQEKPVKKVESTKKKENGIKDRKRKEKPQPTLFDFDKSEQEKSAEEQLIERQLKNVGRDNRKFRIFDKYNENPTAKTFADFLKNEYGWGGHGGYDDDDVTHDAKGFDMKVLGSHGEVLVQVMLKWNEVALRIADLIDDDNYFSEQEKREYVAYREKQNRQKEKEAEEQRQRSAFLERIVLDEPMDRRERIQAAYSQTDEQKELIEFLKDEYGAYTTKEFEGKSIVINNFGIFVQTHDENGIWRGQYLNEWKVVAEKISSLINSDRYIESEPEESAQSDEYDWDYLIDNGEREEIKEEKPFNRFKELTAEGKAFVESYSQRPMREPEYSPWDEVQSCTVIANGIYDVSTEGHGGIMIAEELALHILSPEALNIGFLERGYYCFEEDSDAQAPLRELYDKGILKPEEYFIGYQVSSHRSEAKDGYVAFQAAKESEKKGFLNSWNRSINETLQHGHPEYWEAYEQAVNADTEERIKYLADQIVAMGTQDTYDGGSVIYFDRFDADDEQFIRDNKEDIEIELTCREEVIEADVDDDSFHIGFYLDYCPNLDEDIIVEFYGNADQNENADLTGILNQSELGGAKERYKNNVAAIRLVNKLYAENRDPTDDEKKVLARFVGWGGLSQAFDEHNASWKKEYKELKDLLSAEDYEQAKGSTLNAYYTDKKVIDGIYAGLARMGVKGNNRILEPSMGTGNFFGFMPQEIASGSKLYGVELDNLTGRIATKLYPQANVQIKGFEDTSYPNDLFDIVVGNVPFGGYGVADSDYNRYNFKVHDYFLAKSIDKVKPNGIVAIVTSKGTMDKLNQSARKYVAERAELLGAIRLPNTAFKQTAGTEAVADILFFRKRTERLNLKDENVGWLGIYKTGEGYIINNYFADHPEMILGTLAEETGLYGGVDVTVKDDGRDLSEAIKAAIKKLPQGIYLNPQTAPVDNIQEVDYSLKPLCYKAESGRLFMRVGEEMVEQPIPATPKDAYQRIKAMIDLREELHHILDIQIQGCSDEVLEREQRKLNAQYDRFVRQYGNVNSKTNQRLFRDDGDSALLFACEDINEETKAITKADVFTKRTIRPYVVPTSTDDCFAALQICKNERGKLDISYIEELTGKGYDEVLSELGDAVFRNPKHIREEDKYSGFETAEEYLSGEVVDKLQWARHYAETHPEYQRNVAALEQVQPTPLTASEISVRLGSTWIDTEYYKQFYCELVGVKWYHEGDVQLFYNPYDSSWRLDQKDSVRTNTQMKQKQVFGTTRAPAYRLFVDSLNQRPTTIYDTIEDESGKERRVINQAETIAAREKQNLIKEKFKEWIFQDPERREELEATYNRLFNHTRLVSYDGSYLKFPEMNPAIELKPHQKNAIHRIITSPKSTLLHHVVGSGKTYTMAASIMKMRQLGLCKKAMVAVPNHLVRQWASEWRKLYPNAKLLIATKEDLEKDNRRQFVSKVAMGDWDGIIIAQSSFAKIPISYARQEKKLRDEIWSIEEAIRMQWAENGMPRGAVKNLERIKKSREAMLKRLMDDKKKDSVLDFESLGVDYLYIDEAHYYKNLFLFTKMSNVAGISNAASARASDLKLKCEYLQELHDSDKGVVFATGTPISNSMTEMYTMQTYLQPSDLKDAGITFFDGWAADFGETVTSMELAPSGQGYRARTRFAKFTNLPELLTMYRSFADVQTADMVKLDVPEAERKVIGLKPSDTTIELAERIAERAEEIYGGGVDPHIDNMLKVTSDGKKLALDPRCYVSGSEDEAGSKLNECAERIREIWEETAESKGAQIVFCDLSTPKGKFEDYVYGTDFDAYNDLKYKLVQKGIPSSEIAFIHDATTEEQKQTLFDNVNAGKVRVLIGSTEKCGAGTNVQKRLVALHHLDTPYRPSDMEQREGRIIRQGNTNEKVKIFTYVTERTFDSYSYQILENKQRFISQINRGDLTVREAEDIDETTLSYAEIKAITAANPKIKRKMEVDAEISRLRVLEGQYKKNLYSLQDKIRKDYPEEIRKQELLIERVQRDIGLIPKTHADPEAFEISIHGTVYTDRKEGGKALLEALLASKPETVIAEYCGFKISINPMNTISNEREITLTGEGQYIVTISDSASGNLVRLDNFIEDLPKREERLKNRLKQLNDDLAVAKEQAEKPFEHTERLKELLSEQTQLNTELNLDKREEVIIEDEDDDASDGYYKALPVMSKAIMEEEMIDREDKTAMIQTAVLPDYAVTQERMHGYGYSWDGMLPLTRQTALRLWGMGLQVYKLNTNDTEAEVEKYEDLDDETTYYGIEKPTWKKFCDNEKSVAYFAAKHEMSKAASVVVAGEMSDVDKAFTGDVLGNIFEERRDLETYLAGKNKPADKELTVYTQTFLDDYTDRIWRDKLGQYGWEKSDIPRALLRHIENDEMQKQAREIILLDERLDNLDHELYDDHGNDVVTLFTDGEKYHALIYCESDMSYGFAVGYDPKTGRSESGRYNYATYTAAYLDLTPDKHLMAVKPQSKSYAEFIKDSVAKEYEELRNAEDFYDAPQEETDFYRNMNGLLTENANDNLTESDLQALSTEIPSVLDRLYEYYMNESGNAETTVGLSNLVREYNDTYHKDIVADRYNYHEEKTNYDYELFTKSGEPIDGLYQDYDEDFAIIHEKNGAYALAIGYDIETGEYVRLVDGFDRYYGASIYLFANYDAEPVKQQNKSYVQIVKEHIARGFFELDKSEKDYQEKIGFQKRLNEFFQNSAESKLREVDFEALFMDVPYITYSVYDWAQGYYKSPLKTDEDFAYLIKSYNQEQHRQFMPKDPNIKNNIYLKTSEYAMEHGERELFRDSYAESRECLEAIGSAISANYHDNTLGKGFEKQIVDAYGMERVKHVLATVIQEHEWDGRYSRENKAWAKAVPVSESQSVRRGLNTNTHPGLLDLFVNRIRNMENEKNEKENNMDDNEKYLTETRQDSKWVEINVSKNALIKRYDNSSHFRMPLTNEEYKDYSYYVFNNRIKESRQLVDLQSDGRELCYKLLFKEDDTVVLKNRDGDEKQFTPQEFKELVGGTSDKDYERTYEKLKINLPREAIIATYDKATLMAMPTGNKKYKGYSYYVPNSVIEEDKENENGRINVSVGGNFKFKLRKGEEQKEITAEQLYDMVNGTSAVVYEREPNELDDYREQNSDDGADEKKWFSVPIGDNAFISEYEKANLFRMPKGEYAGRVYYLPHGMLNETRDSKLYLRIPEDFEIHLKGGADGKEITLTAEQFVEALKGKTDEDYESIYRQPSEEAKKQFEKVEARLRQNVPELLRNRPNWVIVRTKENMETGRLDKFLINPHTGKFAESDNPETWTDFDSACKYAKENGGVALAYALDGKDNVACIDLDGCIEKNGDFSPLAKQVFDNCGGTYCEKSVSGKGLHFFGITKGADLRSFSKDGDMEYYQGGHFITMTGDDYGNTALKSFDTPEMKDILESKLEKRTEWKNAGAGMEGLSSLDDREVLEKAFASKNGDIIKRYYNGEDVRNNRSNSDMSWFNYLAFWCGHDINQMLRINATSAAFRPDKPQSYYEHTAIKAVKGTPVYTPPKASNNKPSGNGSGNGKDGK